MSDQGLAFAFEAVGCLVALYTLVGGVATFYRKAATEGVDVYSIGQLLASIGLTGLLLFLIGIVGTNL